MDPITIVIVPGFIGGLVFALLLARLNRRSEQSDPFTAEWPSTDIINMARIRVAGVGGLGLVAMAVVVAINIPKIRQLLTIGLALGVLFGVVLVLWRRRAGPMPSSGRRPGANTTLSIDLPSPSESTEREVSNVQEFHATAAPPSPCATFETGTRMALQELPNTRLHLTAADGRSSLLNRENGRRR